MFEDFENWLFINTNEYLFMLGFWITHLYPIKYFWAFWRESG